MNIIGKALAFGGVAATALLLAANVSAAPIQCVNDTEDRYMELDNITGGPPACDSAGTVNEPSPFNGEPLLWKIEFGEGTEGPGPDPFVSFSGGTGTSGTLELIEGLTNHFLVFKFGNGGGDPDWFAYAINGMTKADWAFFANEGSSTNGLSHVAVYGSPTDVPEPAGIVLLGAGLVLLGLRARRRQSI